MFLFKKDKPKKERPPFQMVFFIITLLLIAYIFNTNRDHFTPSREQVFDSLGIKVVEVPESDNAAGGDKLGDKTNNPDSHK